MWIMLNNTFISIVSKDCAPDELMVRARRPGDIERLFPETEGKVKPFTGSDYHYRAPVKRGRIAAALSRCVADIGYSNFKDSVKDRPLHDAYLRVWHAMASLQPEAPYSGRPRFRMDRLTPYEDAHVFATGHMPDDADTTPADFDDGMGGTYRPGVVIDADRKKKGRAAKKNTRGR